MGRVAYVYLNGLGDGQPKWHERVALRLWARAGTPLNHIPIDWFSDQSLSQLLKLIETKIDELLESYDGVALLGSSASGSLALNAYYSNADKNVCYVNAHGRLAVGKLNPQNRNSLKNRAEGSISFYQSVVSAEKSIAALTGEHKERMLVLTQLTDLIVPLETMRIEGVRTHTSLAFGHSGGYLAHFWVDRRIVTEFASQVLQSNLASE